MATAEIIVLDDRVTDIWPVGESFAWAVELGRSAFQVEVDRRAAFQFQIGERWTVLEAVLALSISTVALSSGEIGDVDYTTLDLTWSAAVSSSSSDYTLGMSLTVNGNAAAIVSAVLQPGSQVVRIVLAAAVGVSDTVAAAYDSSSGDLVDGSSLAVASTTSSVVNNVGTHLYFDQEDDAIHWVTSL